MAMDRDALVKERTRLKAGDLWTLTTDCRVTQLSEIWALIRREFARRGR